MLFSAKWFFSPFSQQAPKLVLFPGLTNARQSKRYNMKETENKSRKEALAWLPRHSRTGEVDAVALVIRTGGALVPQEGLQKQQSCPWTTKKKSLQGEMNVGEPEVGLSEWRETPRNMRT